MLILEFNQYKKYLEDKKFMEYFNSMNDMIKELFPDYNLNLELSIEQVNWLFLEGYTIEDGINWLYYNGNLFQFRVTNGDS